MPNRRIENLNVSSEDTLITPAELKRRFPLTDKSVQTVMNGQSVIKNILEGKDRRLFVVVGPCSIHDVTAAKDYALRLKRLADEVDDTLFLLMRVYFEKPRTRTGWQGLINDPCMDGSGKFDEGLTLARELLLYVANLGLPAAGEALDLVSPQYIQDLFSWSAIGARTTESQTHRKMASGFSSTVGFKNGTNGKVTIAINAMLTAANPNSFISVDPEGHVAVIRTKGNKYTHIVLRGGESRVNYDADSIFRCERELREAGLPENIMVDCSHANSQSDPNRQLGVLDDITRQIVDGNRSIIGLMLESNIEGGKQAIPSTREALKYGVSITDACIDWSTTERVINQLREKLKGCLLGRRKLS
ncbi:MAG: 3-deoxy-7-phosphoheptulonate synthase [Candidatus Scalindua sp. AMX11]|nr:MAG: 3-deoxy-7-phosphoheptulonate synthase [Candidatus Scalindua sp.]NOG85151.1 3-deoxy-7-phosphoheptulonate synthase [Planctomycetota bacterium]RZV67645.1 MAG: 3-deoxy-7-phosphoheptulonate synthase [Candidatus Scalindua sp. SCAELEC01]TDE63698.1 MAG: 3-deoxy-7-phosphoheptulonate synthase [Candidatus Scalindua sp. AMX11]GJQ57223.1 MAG: phospho-2-dehydro-3-deoxyheptonate aldolase [Candidatus Scalindua sp.]